MKTSQQIMFEALQEKYDELACGVEANIHNLIEALGDIGETKNNSFDLDRAIFSAQQIKEFLDGDDE